MPGVNNGNAYPCVAIDLNTQFDFCADDGACCVTNLEALMPKLERIVAWALASRTPMVSSVDSHRQCELPKGGKSKHCVDGTIGQDKLSFTMLSKRMSVQVDNTLSAPLDLFRSFQQVIFRQRGEDLLANPKADRFLSQLPVGEFLLFGNVAEEAIRSVALGFVAREKPITVVRDACGYWDQVAADLSFRVLQAKGVNVVSLDELLERMPAGNEILHKRPERANGNGILRHDPMRDTDLDRLKHCPRKPKSGPGLSNTRIEGRIRRDHGH